MKIRKFTSIAAFVFLVGLVALQGTAARADLHIGKWRLNLGKSKTASGQAPKSETRTYEQQGVGGTRSVVSKDGKILTVTSLDANGQPTGNVLVFDKL